MLSVLIPVYNFDVRNFISQLHEQAIHENIKFEIIIADDNSDENFKNINAEITILPNVKYIKLDKNIGRSKIRNFLAEKASFDNLIFADCDMSVINTDFIHTYIKFLNTNSVICGGISYQTEKPKDKELILRWYYGIKKEKRSDVLRNRSPYASFMSGNFLIPKKIFQNIRFDERISKYGHEDTLFGIELKRKGIKIKHITNPLLHIGLEPSETFISKTEKSIENLIFISENYNYPELYNEIKLLSTAKKIHLTKPLILFFFNIFQKQILRNLKSKKPRLFLFDFYKLAILYKKQQLIVKK